MGPGANPIGYAGRIAAEPRRGSAEPLLLCPGKARHVGPSMNRPQPTLADISART